jgi:hypothetical protein
VAKRKKSEHTKLKEKAWANFSKYIRLKNADKDGNCRCVTCGVTKHWKEIHSGHFIDGRSYAVLFDERLVHPQCFHCNGKHWGCLSGNKVRYTLFMLSKGYTKEEIEGFDNLKHTTVPMKDYQLQEILDTYKQKVKDLENERP